MLFCAKRQLQKKRLCNCTASKLPNILLTGVLGTVCDIINIVAVNNGNAARIVIFLIHGNGAYSAVICFDIDNLIKVAGDGNNLCACRQ